MTAFNDDFFNSLHQAEQAAARADIETAERWTSLAERQFAMAHRMLETFLKAGLDPKSIPGLRNTLPNRAARRAVRSALR
jgi:hypothetical protein